MSVFDTLLNAVTWWNGATLNTRLFTWRNGVEVGKDAQGNIFYQSRDGARRWVIYNGEADASRIAPEWHGWGRPDSSERWGLGPATSSREVSYTASWYLGATEAAKKKLLVKS